MTVLVGLLLGLGLGALGTLTGVGGGFLLMPALLWLFPNQPQGALSLASLTVVFFNSLSGTVLSARLDRVHFRTGLTYGVVSLPMVWWGLRGQTSVNRPLFNVLFGLFLLVAAIFLAFRRPAPGQSAIPSHSTWLIGAAISLVVGAVAGFFGVGGGFLFVPLLAFFLKYPVAEASATSQLIVGIGSAFALLTGAATQTMPLDPMLLSGLVAGVLVGAPAGVWAAGRWSPAVVLRILAVLLVVVGVRLLVDH